MKTLRFIGMAIVAIIMSVNFAACSDDDEDDNNPLIGTWINSEGNTTMTWIFKANGTGVEKYEDVYKRQIHWNLKYLWMSTTTC